MKGVAFRVLGGGLLFFFDWVWSCLDLVIIDLGIRSKLFELVLHCVDFV